jgi:hypothetical protein
MRWIHAAPLAGLFLATGCLSDDGSTPGGDCTSHYEVVADAPTRAALKRELLEEVDPRVRTLRVIDEDPDDGTWTAQQWSQCID